MSGLLHPVGPEPVMTYWARRALVLGAAMVLAIVSVLIISGTSSGSAAQLDPPPGEDSAGAPTASTKPDKSPAKRKVKSLDTVSGAGKWAWYVPGRREICPIDVLVRCLDPLRRPG